MDTNKVNEIPTDYEMSAKEQMKVRQAKVWTTLSVVDVNSHTSERVTQGTKLTYLSWSWAWAEVMKKYPTAVYAVERDSATGAEYTATGLGIMVHTRVTIEGLTRGMWLPVMDGANRALKLEAYTIQKRDYKTGKLVDVVIPAATVMDVNKAIMRCLTKNIAMFGLGLNIYAGEDLPVGDDGMGAAEVKAETPKSGARKPVGASVAAGGTSTPLKAQSASAAKFTAEAMEAWQAWKKLPNVAKMSSKEQNESFAVMVRKVTGRGTHEIMTEAEPWKAVMAEIEVEGVL